MKWRMLFWLVLAGCSACAADATIGGYCNTTEDCHSELQSIPGTSCVEFRCVCDNPNEMHCCPGGSIEKCESQPPNDYRCRPAAECQPHQPDAGTTTGSGGAGTTSSGAGGAPGTGGTGGEPLPPPECLTDADCPDPPNAACGEGKCFDGICLLDIWEGPTASQLYGDCKQTICDVYGNKLEVIDVGDFYNDGNQCTLDYCFGDIPSNDLLPNGIVCPEAQLGYCFEGACVDCIAMIPNAVCGNELVCNEVWCEPFGQCGGACGGVCAPCANAYPCSIDADCLSKVCMNGSCQLPTCMDGVKNGDESGMDCGAPSCPFCPDGEGCKLPADCASGVCAKGICQAPSCTDAIQNGMESGIDCGGNCNPCLP